jgi:TRAP transporter TAXI family solute receptor
MIANAVSQPGKIVVTAQASNGSVANVNGINGGAMESGFSQADVATWAQKGTGIYEGKPNVPGLRLIANLYPESVHVVVKKGSGIKSVADLKGKRVALDEPGSGTIVNARAILAAYGVSEKDIKPEYIKPNQAGDKMKDGSLDAFFFTGGAPAGAIAELASSPARASRSCPSTARKAKRCARPAPSLPRTTSRPTPTRAWARSTPWPWVRSG